MSAGKGRVLIAKIGLDGHDRGSRLVTRLLIDAGFEVIYSGLRQTPEQVVRAAFQEDVDAIGISILSGSHMSLVPRVLDLLREADASDDIAVVAGGIIPDEDADRLLEAGVAAIFGPGASTEEIVGGVENAIRRHAGRGQALETGGR